VRSSEVGGEEVDLHRRRLWRLCRVSASNAEHRASQVGDLVSHTGAGIYFSIDEGCSSTLSTYGEIEILRRSDGVILMSSGKTPTSRYEEAIEARRLGIPVLDEDEVVLTRSGIRAWVESLPRRSIGGG
jgi:hypothetical protein